VADIFAKLRRTLVAAQFRHTGTEPPTQQEINLIRLAWAEVAA
jgi:hypothetical protein